MSTVQNQRTLPKLIQDLLMPGVELIETHISWVLRHKDVVYKIKKPVDLGFLDFRQLSQRHEKCHAEVTLNRRLAKSVYRGVVPITRDSAGIHQIGGNGEIVDYAVEMVRMFDNLRCDHRVRSNLLTPHHVQLLSTRLAQFHQAARCDEETSSFGSIPVIVRNLRENFEQTADLVTQHITVSQAKEVEAYQMRFLREHAEHFESRISDKKIRDGHGDLRLEHVYFTDTDNPLILDCIEFNNRFRFADVCADIAFLAMDLAWHGRVDLAEILIASYARETNDFELYRLIDFYISYRAYIRGKVSAFVASDLRFPAHIRKKASKDARRFFLLSLATERRSPTPAAIIAIGGIIASGKSTVSDAISVAMGIPVVDTDRTRKFLANANATKNISTGLWSDYYAPEFTHNVYAEVYKRARHVLSSGRSVILDASFRTRSMRREVVQLAKTYDVPCYFVECQVASTIAKKRLKSRSTTGTSVSDGRLELFQEFAAAYEPINEVPPEYHIALDTSRPLENNIPLLRAKLPGWPERLHAQTIKS